MSALTSDQWMRERELRMISLFKEAAVNVPAYADFLSQAHINPDQVNTYEDFKNVPFVNKKNYLTQYPIESLCWNGKIADASVYTATSGSTGTPFYFLRTEQLDWQYSVLLEEFLERNDILENSPTLVVVCFGMGLWIGGLITYKGFEIAAIRNKYQLSLITPGFNKKEIFSILEKLAPKYKQTILAGYPPFIKDILDEAEALSIPLKNLNIKTLFAAEAISEKYRDYIAEKIGSKNIFRDIMSIYGSADIGAMATETTSATLIKRLARDNEQLFSELFSPIKKTPTLAQFNPHFINFEEQDGQLLLTGNNAMPLIRYAIGDSGGVFSFAHASKTLSTFGINLHEEAAKAGISSFVQELPFVYVYERIDLSTSFYGLLIYPEWIKAALYDEAVSGSITGKFTMLTKSDEHENQYLEINIEMKKEVDTSDILKSKLSESIVQSLLKHSSEYREIEKGLGDFARPRIVLWPAEDPLFFKPGVKQKWVEK